LRDLFDRAAQERAQRERPALATGADGTGGGSVKRQLKGASIRRKLIALTLTVILVPVFCVLAIVGEKEIRDIQTDMLASSALMGSMVAEFGAAALAFENETAAEQVLHTLGNHEEFLDAALYDLAGRRFAAYSRNGDIGEA